MTWRLKVQGVVLAGVILGALALAAGADWINCSFLFSWF